MLLKNIIKHVVSQNIVKKILNFQYNTTKFRLINIFCTNKQISNLIFKDWSKIFELRLHFAKLSITIPQTEYSSEIFQLNASFQTLNNNYSKYN